MKEAQESEQEARQRRGVDNEAQGRPLDGPLHGAHCQGPKRKHIYGRTRQEVATKLAQATSDQDGTLVFDAGNLTLGEYLDRWLKDSVKDTVRISTYERHEAIIRIHLKPAFGKLKLKAVTPAHIQGLYRDRLDGGLSPATVQKIHAVWHKALEQAMRWRLVPNNVAD